jgi:hypothetical protein
MGPSESPTRPRKRQAAGRRRQPRRRLCLLKGCEQKYHPQHRQQRYCSARCREEARKWSRWKAQQRYRDTAAGRQKRKRQSRRYRERVKHRKPEHPEPLNETARVITNEHFFRTHLRPARVLRVFRRAAAKPFATLLFARLPTRVGACSGARAALETGAHLIPTY